MISKASRRLLLAVFLMALSATAFAKGRLGFGVSVATDGMFSSTLQEVKVTKVRPDSPAQAAGLLGGDVITEMAGVRVKGSSGLALQKSLASVKQGDHLKLVVLRAGKSLPLEIVAGADQ
jgi:S1-C subfamily serine protease